MMMGMIGVISTYTPSWQVAYSRSLTADSTGWNGFNLRQVINSSNLSLGGTKVRVTLQAAIATSGFTIDHAEIGHAAGAGDPYDYDGGQIALTFSGGSASVVVATGGSVLSDEMTFTLDNTKNFIIAMHFSATSTLRAGSNTGAPSYFKSAASEVSTSDVTGYTTGGSSFVVNKVEVFA
jgi:hypothetical protein